MAKAYEPKGIANGIKWIIENYNKEDQVSLKYQKGITQDFSTDLIVDKYIEFYQRIITSYPQ